MTKPRKQPNRKTSDGDERKTKKTGAGRGRGVGVDNEVRVEGGVLGQDEETQGPCDKGNPEPSEGGLGFPSAWEREERKNTASTNRPNKEKKGDTDNKTKRVLKGSKRPDKTPTPEKSKNLTLKQTTTWRA